MYIPLLSCDNYVFQADQILPNSEEENLIEKELS